jgi:nucleoside-diphosphate kinase
MSNITLTIIKPDAVKRGESGKIIDAVLESGFKIVALKMHLLSRKEAEKFYDIHSEKAFFQGLIDYMTSGVVIIAVLQKENAVENFRKLIGATDPAKAEEGTIRKRFGKSVEQNVIHGSDSDQNAQIESSFFFSGLEIYKS